MSYTKSLVRIHTFKNGKRGTLSVSDHDHIWAYILIPAIGVTPHSGGITINYDNNNPEKTWEIINIKVYQLYTLMESHSIMDCYFLTKEEMEEYLIIKKRDDKINIIIE